MLYRYFIACIHRGERGRLSGLPGDPGPGAHCRWPNRLVIDRACAVGDAVAPGSRVVAGEVSERYSKVLEIFFFRLSGAATRKRRPRRTSVAPALAPLSGWGPSPTLAPTRTCVERRSWALGSSYSGFADGTPWYIRQILLFLRLMSARAVRTVLGLECRRHAARRPPPATCACSLPVREAASHLKRHLLVARAVWWSPPRRGSRAPPANSQSIQRTQNVKRASPCAMACFRPSPWPCRSRSAYPRPSVLSRVSPFSPYWRMRMCCRHHWGDKRARCRGSEPPASALDAERGAHTDQLQVLSAHIDLLQAVKQQAGVPPCPRALTPGGQHAGHIAA